MKTLKLIIMPDGRAKELNPWGERPVRNQRVHGELMYQHKLSNWKEAEANRKSYQLDDYNVIKYTGHDSVGVFLCSRTPGQRTHMPTGTIVEAEIINENTVRVVKIVNE